MSETVRNHLYAGRARIAAALLAVAIAAPAVAAGVVPLDGVFGNAEGCRAYETGQPRGAYLVLTGDTFSSAEIGCAFQALISARRAVLLVSAVCSPGGTQTVQIVDHGAAGYAFIAASGLELGPLLACSPPKVTGSLTWMKA